MDLKGHCADVLIVLSLGFLCFDILVEWEGFSGCAQPIQWWLITSYAMLAASRTAVVLGSALSTRGSGNFLVNARQKGTTLRFLFSFTWLLFPVFTAWSVLGALWTWDVWSNNFECMPSLMHTSFLLLWKLISFGWICGYALLGWKAWIMERRVRRAEADFREIQSADDVDRWEGMGSVTSYMALEQRRRGLTPGQIRELPGAMLLAEGQEAHDCAICLNPMSAGEHARKLEGCGHSFHRCCLDLWLLRSEECPLCKRPVSPPGAA